MCRSTLSGSSRRFFSSDSEGEKPQEVEDALYEEDAHELTVEEEADKKDDYLADIEKMQAAVKEMWFTELYSHNRRPRPEDKEMSEESCNQYESILKEDQKADRLERKEEKAYLGNAEYSSGDSDLVTDVSSSEDADSDVSGEEFGESEDIDSEPTVDPGLTPEERASLTPEELARYEEERARIKKFTGYSSSEEGQPLAGKADGKQPYESDASDSDVELDHYVGNDGLIHHKDGHVVEGLEKDPFWMEQIELKRQNLPIDSMGIPMQHFNPDFELPNVLDYIPENFTAPVEDIDNWSQEDKDKYESGYAAFYAASEKAMFDAQKGDFFRPQVYTSEKDTNWRGIPKNPRFNKFAFISQEERDEEAHYAAQLPKIQVEDEGQLGALSYADILIYRQQHYSSKEIYALCFPEAGLDFKVPEEWYPAPEAELKKEVRMMKIRDELEKRAKDDAEEAPEDVTEDEVVKQYEIESIRSQLGFNTSSDDPKRSRADWKVFHKERNNRGVNIQHDENGYLKFDDSYISGSMKMKKLSEWRDYSAAFEKLVKTSSNLESSVLKSKRVDKIHGKVTAPREDDLMTAMKDYLPGQENGPFMYLRDKALYDKQYKAVRTHYRLEYEKAMRSHQIRVQRQDNERRAARLKFLTHRRMRAYINMNEQDLMLKEQARRTAAFKAEKYARAQAVEAAESDRRMYQLNFMLEERAQNWIKSEADVVDGIFRKEMTFPGFWPSEETRLRFSAPEVLDGIEAGSLTSEAAFDFGESEDEEKGLYLDGSSEEDSDSY